MSKLQEIIRGRRSVRTFDGQPVSAEDREKLEQYIATITNPFGIPVRFVLLDAKEHGLSSPVLSGETLFHPGSFSLQSVCFYSGELPVGCLPGLLSLQNRISPV